jgi:inhibitor of KinA
MSTVKAPATYPIKPVSENMLTIIVGDSVDLQVNQKVFRLYHHLLKYRHASWMDVIPAYTTVSIVYDIVSIRQQHASGFEWMKNHIEKLLTEDQDRETISPRQLRVPVCYDREFALDTDRIIKEKNISWDQLIELHTSNFFHTFMIGFLPGFAYMGPVDQRIAIPRISTPRTQVPAGSVGIAGEQTGIYPLDSPGGWNIIGRTPLKIFDPASAQPVVFRTGDQVKFVPISKAALLSFDQSSYQLIA